jgi:surface antigen
VGDRKVSVFSACLAATVVCSAGTALAHGAKSHRSEGGGSGKGHHHHRHGSYSHLAYHHHGHTRYAYYGARVIQCVAFARQDAGIDISGNARDWWGRAAGVYERGRMPEAGSVLSFRPTSRMPLGHVAVVSGIEDSRTILIDQSHWASRGISRAIEVKDVSENNDWSAVRVQLSHGGAFGSIYPTHGFIYPRPDRGDGAVNASQEANTILAAAPASMRVTVHPVQRAIEVAEAPARGKPIDMTIPSLGFNAPTGALR